MMVDDAGNFQEVSAPSHSMPVGSLLDATVTVTNGTSGFFELEARNIELNLCVDVDGDGGHSTSFVSPAGYSYSCAKLAEGGACQLQPHGGRVRQECPRSCGQCNSTAQAPDDEASTGGGGSEQSTAVVVAVVVVAVLAVVGCALAAVYYQRRQQQSDTSGPITINAMYKADRPGAGSNPTAPRAAAETSFDTPQFADVKVEPSWRVYDIPAEGIEGRARVLSLSDGRPVQRPGSQKESGSAARNDRMTGV